MRKRLFGFFLLILPLFVLLPKTYAQEAQERVIVVFKERVSPEEKQPLVEKFGGQWQKELKLINAAAVTLPSRVKELLKADPHVLRVDPDVEVFALETTPADVTNLSRRVTNESICDWIPNWPGCTPTPTPTPSLTPTPTPTPTPAPTASSNQPIPWGIARIGAPSAWSLSRGSGVKVAVIDTGIVTLHPDLKDNLAGCVNFIFSWRTCEDDNGHGTHVSGIIAAKDNTFGVVGVAPLAKIYSLKVLNRRGSGYLSDIISALDWSVANGMQVVNMSLGTTSDIQSFHDAITRVYNAGITEVAAAGNSGPTANSVNFPGAYPEVIGVAATDSSDAVPSWSSRGPQVDIAAPGASIYSTYLKNGYATLSGTSMASPHVAGTVALRLFVKPSTSPSQMRTTIQTNADSLPFGPTLVGAGLVNAYKVVTAP